MTYSPEQMRRKYAQVQGIDPQTRQRLTEEYLPLVKRIAGGVKRKAPSSISLDDLIGAGMLGLVDAITRFDPEREEQFRALVKRRIRGSMIDEIRSQSPLSRDMRTKSSNLAQAIRDLERDLGRQPNEEEIAERLDIPLEKYHELLVQLQHATVLSPTIVDQAMDTPRGYPDRVPGNPQDDVIFAELQGRLATAISKLSDKQQRVLAMYYSDEISLKEIGEKFGVSESRICQVRSEAVHRLRAMLED